MLIRTAFIGFALTAALAAAPQLQLSTSSIGPVHVFPGANGPTQTSEAFNVGSGSLNLTVTASAPWLSASVGALQACTTRSGSCNPVNVSLNTASLTSGAYTGFITVTDPAATDSPKQISVAINVVGVPAALTEYVTPFGGATPSTYAPIYPKGTVTGTVATQSGGNWLQFISGGFVSLGSPYGVQVAVQKGLAVGSYSGTVVLSGSNAADNLTINVTMQVTNSPVIQPVTTPVLLAGYKGTKQSATVSFANIGSGTLIVTSATPTSSTPGVFTVTNAGNSGITVTADPGTLAPGYYTASIAIASNAVNNAQIAVPVVFYVEAPGVPLIYSSGVVNIGNYSSDPAAPGEILAIFGDQLAPAGTFAQNPGLPPLATTLGTVQVLVNNVPAPLYFTSPGQVNFQLPYEVPASQVTSVQVVSNGVPGNLRPLNIVSSVPRLLAWASIAGNYAIAVNQDYTLVLPSSTVIGTYTSRPAKAGDTITIYCTGLGQTSPAAVTGAAASSTTLQSVSNVTVTFGGGFQGNPVTVPAYFAGLTPTAVGLYQVNVTLPPGLPTGAAVPVTINVNSNGVASNNVNIAVSQ